MAAGGLLPDQGWPGVILVIIGANVAFYGLRQLSQSFAWGAQSQPMLRLCGLAFFLGLFLLAASTRLSEFNSWLAMTCVGVYITLFAVIISHIPVGDVGRYLGIGGLLSLMLGSLFGYLAWQDWQVMRESQSKPQELTLAALVQKGYAGNRYVRVRDFRFCRQWAAEEADEDALFKEAWIPLMPLDGENVTAAGPAPDAPNPILIIAGYAGARLDRRDPLLAIHEKNGFEGTVVNGIRHLKREVREQLRKIAPQTDLAKLIVLDWRDPAEPAKVYAGLAAGAAGILLGLAAIGFLQARAWRIVGKDGWQPPTASQTEVESLR
jgi:hypothetical protein